jgi:hypothetical protein
MRFHKLIQSKVVWIIFLSIIVVSFVALQVASDSTPDPAAARLKQPVARINGKEVSFLELDITRRLIGLQTRNRMNPEMLDDLALNHLAMVEYAQSLGISVETEFAASQFALNFTNEEGELDESALNRFRQNIRGTQISEPDYIEFIRQQIVVDQLRNVLAGSILVPEFEVDRWASLQTDEFVLAYSPLGPEILTGEIEVSDEEVEAFFEENSERFMLPEERIVRYITVTTDSFADQIDPPTQEEAREAYLSEPEAYLRTVESQDEDGTESTQTEPIPFEEVRDQILAELTAERALEAAESAAMSLAIRMTPRRGRSAEAFDAVAEDAGLEITTTEPFSQRTPLEGAANTRPFKQAAFELDFSEFGQRAGPVQVGEEFVIMELVEVLPPRIPSLEEVAERVTQAAIQQKRREALTTQVDVVAENIRKAVNEGRSFEEAAREQELNVLTSDPVSLMTLDPRTSMIPNALIRELPAHQAGDVIGPVQSQFGGFFLASVLERSPRPEAKEEARAETRQMLTSQVHFQGMFNRFQEEVIQPMIEML